MPHDSAAVLIPASYLTELIPPLTIRSSKIKILHLTI